MHLTFQETAQKLQLAKLIWPLLKSN